CQQALSRPDPVRPGLEVSRPQKRSGRSALDAGGRALQAPHETHDFAARDHAAWRCARGPAVDQARQPPVGNAHRPTARGLHHGNGKAMSQQRLKIEVARAALKQVEDGMTLGVGTGSTVNAFIDELAASGIRLEGAVSSSEETTRRLKAAGVNVVDLNQAGDLELYSDAAD